MMASGYFRPCVVYVCLYPGWVPELLFVVQCVVLTSWCVVPGAVVLALGREESSGDEICSL